MKRVERTLFGSSYYPPHHDPADWPRDLDRMVEAGLTVIRSGELLASWDHIEVAPGRFDFGWLDRLFELAGERGIKIILGTGSCVAPVWMAEAYPDLQVVSRDGVQYPIGSMWSWACRDHPAYRTELSRWLETLAERYGQRPELIGWQIDNEIGYPFVERQGRGSDLYCYCAHTEDRFREWLQAHYGTPEALSGAWRWDPTNHRYSSWSQVRAPRSQPVEWGVVTAWLDWRRFIAESMAAFVGWQREQLGRLTPTQPTMTNVFIWSRHDPFGIWIGQDPWRLAEQVDAIGFDYYPGIGERFLREPAYSGFFLDFARSSARHAGVDYWLAEVESGPINGWVLGPDHWTDADDIRRLNADGLGSGANRLLYQGFREWNCIPIHWGALVDLAGEPTERLAAAGEVAHAIEPIAATLPAMTCRPADVAVFHDFDNAIAVAGMAAGPFLLEALTGAYTAFAGAGFEVDFVGVDELEHLECRLLVLPFTMLLSEAAGAAVERFVAQGGTLLAFAKAATLDGRGWSWDVRPGAGLADVLGVREASVKVDRGPIALVVAATPELPGWEGGEISGAWHRQVLAPYSDTTVLGRFEDGSIGSTFRRHGAGLAIAIGTHLDVAVARGGFGSGSDLLASIAARSGARRLWQAPVSADGLPRVFVRHRADGQRGFLTITSTDDVAVAATILVRAQRATDLVSGAELPIDPVFRVDVPARGTRLILLEGIHD